MKLLVTGICGFVGSSLVRRLAEQIQELKISGIDNLSRKGSEANRAELGTLGVRFIHGDVRMPSDLVAIGPSDWVIDAAAQPSVLAGVDGRSSPRQLAEHNLLGTLNILEYCRQYKAGLILLSTSRVYSVQDLATLPVKPLNGGFQLDQVKLSIPGATPKGISESFPTRHPISLYGATKFASEIMACEYGAAFGFPVWINRCGVLAGAGQFGTAEQGVFSYWVHAHAARLPLRYIGFGGLGHQVRDALHPDDLAGLLRIQLDRTPPDNPIFNIGGGLANSMSLGQLTAWCDQRFGPHAPQPDHSPRPFDAPWLVMDSGSAQSVLGWTPQRPIASILHEIADHAARNPAWLKHVGAI